MPSYVFTYRQPKDQPLNMEAADEWFKWFDEIGEHITVPGSAVSTHASSATSTAASGSAASP